ncbi:MAG TPA: GxxExxY protein [Chloroflexia bacterium]|jgi:GxxExxY protein
MLRDSRGVEPDEAVDQIARRAIGAALEVHRVLGPGFLEVVYEEALCVELSLRKIPFVRQAQVPIWYKAQQIGEGRLDLLVADCLIVELKAVEALAPIHTAQLLSYLRATGQRLGLLINFNVPLLRQGIKRVALTR